MDIVEIENGLMQLYPDFAKNISQFPIGICGCNVVVSETSLVWSAPSIGSNELLEGIKETSGACSGC